MAVIEISNSPLQSANDSVHKRFKGVMVDGHIYDTSNSCYPATTSAYTITITDCIASDTVYIEHNAAIIQALHGKVSYDIRLVPVIGRNTIQAIVNGIRSNLLSFSTDELQALIYPMVLSIRDAEVELRQAWANGYLNTGVTVDTDGDLLDPTAEALADSWGSYLGVNRLSGHTASEYMAMLQTMVGVYQRGAVAQSLLDVVEAASGGEATGNVVMKMAQVARPHTTKFPRVYKATGGTVDLEIFPQKVKLGNRLYNVGYQSGLTLTTTVKDSINHTGETSIYVTSEAVAHADGRGNLVAYASTATPVDAVVQITRTFLVGEILSDDTGDVTSFIGEKYIILDRTPISIDSLTVSGYNFTSSCHIIPDAEGNATSIIGLGTRLDLVLLGFTLTYSAIHSGSLHIARIFCNVGATTAPTSITAIHSSTRVGLGAINLSEVGYKKSFVLFGQKPSSDFTDEEIGWLSNPLSNVAPVGARGYLMLKMASPETQPSLDLFHMQGFSSYGEI